MMIPTIKLTGFLLVAGGGIVSVYKIISGVNQRICFLESMISDINFMRNEIFFLNSTVGETFKKLSESESKTGGLYGRLLAEMSEGKSVYSAFCEAFDGSVCKDERDLNILRELFKVLGKTDFEGQKKGFESAGIMLNERLKQAEAYKMKNLKTNCTAVLFGFALVGIILL